MAKRGTPDHPKTVMLAKSIGLPKFAALGLLEALWHWVSRYYPTGFVPEKFLAVAADQIGFAGDLSDILVSSGWLDRIDGGYYVHDWHDHADDSTKKVLSRKGLSFHDSNVNKSRQKKDGVATKSRQVTDRAPTKPGHILDQPEPLPEPKPKPKKTSPQEGEVKRQDVPPPWIWERSEDRFAQAMVALVRTAPGYGSWDPPGEDVAEFLVWVREFAPDDLAVLSVAQSFVDRACGRKKATPEYRNVLLTLRKWCQRDEAEWRKARHYRAKDAPRGADGSSIGKQPVIGTDYRWLDETVANGAVAEVRRTAVTLEGAPFDAAAWYDAKGVPEHDRRGFP